MGTRVVIEIQGLQQVLDNLSMIEEKGGQNLVKQVNVLATDTEQVWQQNTHMRTGRLRGGEVAEAMGLSFTLKNAIYYYDFVNDGHMTPRGWRTRHGYRQAKRRSHVQGQEMTQKAVEFVSQNILDYLSKFLDGV